MIDLVELCGATTEYNIPVKRCQSSEQILGWIYHLSGKTWLTRDVLRRFVALSAQEAGVELNSH